VLKLVHPSPGEETIVNLGPTREAIVSWNALAPAGALELRINTIDGRTSAWLPYVAFSSEKRASLATDDGFVRIDTDVVRARVDFTAIGVRSADAVEAVFVSTPDYGAPSSIVALPAVALDVPAYSQYEPAYPQERGWCAPASLAMLLAYRDYPVDVPIVAREVFDSRYGGTGNWTFNTAFAGRLGFPSAVMHLRDLAHAHAFLVDDIPLALSIAWEPGDVPGAPLDRSSGHLVVLRGIAASGDAIVNDPAVKGVAIVYPRDAFEAAWLRHGGIAFAVAPGRYVEALLRLANG
jgi:hypothetical protein